MKNKPPNLLTFYIFFLFFLASCQQQKTILSRPPSNPHQPYNFIGKKGMVVAAHPLAARSGLEILKKGGNAVDAAIATAFALNVVEPFASGIGGGGFMVIYLAKEKKVTTINFREKAPQRAHPMMFEENGKTNEDWRTAHGLAVATPGALAGWSYALKKYGTLTFAEVSLGACELAEKGFSISPTFSTINKDEYEKLLKNAGEETCYLHGGLPYEPGEILRNPELADTFQLVASKGIDVFYRGEIARKIVESVQNKGGILSLDDLSSYEVQEKPPLKGTYKDVVLYTISPPGAGGLQIIQLLNIAEEWPLKKWGHNTYLYVHHLAEALRFIFADRERYLGDPDFVPIPVEKLISNEYAAEIRSKIKLNSVLDSYPHGKFEEQKKEQGNTTHLCVVDGEGNAVALTQSINHFFGSGIVPEGMGFLLNNHMDDFSSDPDSPNAAAANRRPVSSMGPLLIFQKEKLYIVLGSPGGTRIFPTLSQIILNILEFGMTIDEAIEAPRFFTYSSEGKAKSLFLESRFPESVLRELEKSGHKIVIRETYDKFFGGAQGILLDPKKKILYGGADSRRDGAGSGY